MKNRIQNTVLFAIFLLTNIAIAQGPDPDNLLGDPNPTDAPLNQYLLVLGIASIFFVYRFLNKKIISSSSSFL